MSSSGAQPLLTDNNVIVLNTDHSSKSSHFMTPQVNKLARASFKGVSDEDKEKFKTSSCLLTISVGQEYHESERFAATVELINESFHSCTVLVCDSLQRHTMALQKRLSADFFYEISLREGVSWLKRNENYLEKLNNLKTIHRWDTFRDHNKFSSILATLQDLLKNDRQYKDIFDVSVKKYLDRRKQIKINQIEDECYVRELCMNYLLEECVVVCIWPELQCQYEVYPNHHNEAIQETMSRFIFKEKIDLLHPLKLKFSNVNKSILSQKFHMVNT